MTAAHGSLTATVIDAGVGNLGNLARALAHVGAAPEVTREPRRIAAARCLLLPGVGAFAPPREALRGAMEEALGEALAAGAWLLGICVGFQLLFEAGEEFGVTDGLGLLPGRVTRLPAGVPVPHIGWNRLHGLGSHPLLAGLEVPADPAGTAGAGAAVVAGEVGAARMSGAAGVPGRVEVPGEANVTGVAGSEETAGEAREAGTAVEVGVAGAAGAAGRLGRYVYFVHSYAPEGVPPDHCLALATHGRAFPAVAARGRVMGTQFHPERSGAAGLRLLANFLHLAARDAAAMGPAAGMGTAAAAGTAASKGSSDAAGTAAAAGPAAATGPAAAAGGRS